jgi:hypothetical protein
MLKPRYDPTQCTRPYSVHRGLFITPNDLFFRYMQQFAVPMLPHMLCEQLCSLNPGVDRYAFSTIFRCWDTFRVVV